MWNVYLATLQTSAVSSVSCFVHDRKRSVIGELWLAELPNVRGRSRTQMLTEQTSVYTHHSTTTWRGPERRGMMSSSAE